MRLSLIGLALLLLAAGQEKAAAPAKVVIVPLVGELDASHVALVKRAAKRIKEEKPALVLFEIDTPGGRIDYMLTVGEEMMNLAPLPTAAYVRPMGQGGITGGAWSAGAFLALSCKKLYMYPGTVIGAAAPVAQTAEGGAEPVGEKYVSAFREKFRARAEQNGYPPDLAVAMVDKDMEVFEVEVDGKKLYLTTGEMEKLRAGGKQFEWPKTPYDSKDKLLTMTDRQVAEAGMGRVAESRAVIYGDHGLSGAAEETFAPSWSEEMTGFLTSPMVSLLLLVGGILGIWVELKTPGFGAAGVLGILAFALLFFGHHLAGLAEIPEILLFVGGLVLVGVEIFLFPGVGVFAITGIICIFAGLILSLQGFTLPDTKGAPWEMDIFLGSLGRVMTAFVAAAAGLLAILRFLPKVPMLNRMVLQAEVGGTAPAPAEIPGLTGRRGKAVTQLHPAGKVEIDGEVLDVVTEGDFIAPGEPVEVLRVEGMRIIVGRRP